MPDRERIAGVVLAGGRSSRMGENKALMEFQGKPLIHHMTEILQEMHIKNIYVSGKYEGYNCLPDSAPFAGPAAAIRGVMERLDNYDGVLFVPVDMPFLVPEILEELLQCDNGACYEERPLPLYLPTAKAPGQGDAVKDMLSFMDITTLPFPRGKNNYFVNINTPEDWKGVTT